MGNPLRFDRRTAIMFIVPAVISVAMFIIYPLVYTAILSFSKINLSDNSLAFIGIDNFRRLFSDKEFWHSLVITAKFSIFVVLLSSTAGLFIALLLSKKFFAQSFFRSISILPWAVPWVIIGLMWMWMLDSQFGSLNGLLYQLGIITKYRAFLRDYKSVYLYVALPVIWRQSAFSAIILMAPVNSVPGQLYESSLIDGANVMQRFFHITIPWILPTLVIVTFINCIYALMHFDTVYIMTQGGPGNASNIISIFMYRKAFDLLNLGQGVAIGYILALATALLGLLFIITLNRVEKAYGV